MSRKSRERPKSCPSSPLPAHSAVGSTPSLSPPFCLQYHWRRKGNGPRPAQSVFCLLRAAGAKGWAGESDSPQVSKVSLQNQPHLPGCACKGNTPVLQYVSAQQGNRDRPGFGEAGRGAGNPVLRCRPGALFSSRSTHGQDTERKAPFAAALGNPTQVFLSSAPRQPHASPGEPGKDGASKWQLARVKWGRAAALMQPSIFPAASSFILQRRSLFAA